MEAPRTDLIPDTPPAVRDFSKDSETFDVDYENAAAEDAWGQKTDQERAREKRTAIILALGAEGTIEFDRPKKLPFLLHFAEHGSILKAAAYAGVSMGGVDRWRREDTEFAAAFARSKQLYAESVQEVLADRAINGVRKPVWYQGKIVGYEQVYSDRLLVTLMQAKKPDEYARQVSVSGKVEHDHKHDHKIVTQITDEMKGLTGADLLRAMRDRLTDKKLGRTEEEHREARGVVMLPESKVVKSEKSHTAEP